MHSIHPLGAARAQRKVPKEPSMTPGRPTLPLPPFPVPCAAGEVLQWSVDQVHQAICDAWGKIDLLVLETGPALPLANTQAILTPFVGSGTHCAYLGFADVPDAHVGPAGVQSIIGGVPHLWPALGEELLSSLLTQHLVFLDGIVHAITSAPVRIGQLLSWCIGNMELVTVLVPHADCLAPLDLGAHSVAIDRLFPLDGTHFQQSQSETAALIERISR